MPGDELAEEQKKVNRVLGKANIQFSAFAPIFAHTMKKADDGSPVLVGDGGYIISSSNSLTDDMKPENVIAMRDAIARYG